MALLSVRQHSAAALVVGIALLAPASWQEPLAVESALAAKKKKKKKAADEDTAAEAKPAEAKKDAAKDAGKDAKAPPESTPPADEALRTTGPAQIKRDAFSGKKFDNSARADQKRDEAIAEIKSVLPKVKGGQKSELVFRLAELYWDKSKFKYQKEFKDFDDSYQKWVDNGRQGKEPQLASFTKESETFKKQSLDNYRIVLEQFPDYPRLDEVLYIMAYNEYEAGRTEAAVSNYSQLIRQYPKSEYVSDGYLALGEHYFKGNDLPKATKAYKKAYDIGIETKRPSVHRYALYKLAWCDYNAQSYDEALKKFKTVIKGAGSDKKGQGETIDLKREALNDMVLTYSQLDETKDAYEYLKKESGAENAFRLTTKLGAIYKEQGKHALQIDTLRLLINLDPDNTQAPDFQSAVVQAYSQLGDRDAVRKEVTRLVELYRPGSAWWRKNENNAANVERARVVAENRMRELVTDYHRYAQKFKKVDDYEVARDIYAQYLKAFPDSESAYRLNFFYAELLWDIGEWKEAAGQYDAVVARDPKGEYTRTCAYNAVLAWERIVNKVAKPVFRDGKVVSTGCSEDDIKKGKKGCGQKDDKIEKNTVEIAKLDKTKKGSDRYSPQPIPEDEVRLAAACDAYVSVVPDKDAEKDPKLKEELQVVKFKAAYIYQSRYHFDEGAKRYGELIDRWPDSEYARKGADQILDSYDFRENYEALEKWSRTFASKKELMKDDKFAKTVNRFMEGATFKVVDSVRAKSLEADKAGKKDEAKTLAMESAGRFEGFVKEFPKSEFAPIALYNSQLLYASHDVIDLALATSEQLLKEYPKEISAGDNLKNKLEENTVINIAAYHEKMANYPKAADAYVKFADKYKDNTRSPDAIYNAAIFQLGLGNTTEATKLFARYMKDYSKQKDVPAVYLRMAAVYEDQGDWKRTSALYGEFEKLHGKEATPEQILLARYKNALALQKAGRDKEMREACEGILAGYKKLDDKVKKSDMGQRAGGYCAFQTLEPVYQEYKAITIEARGSGRKALQLIKEALDRKQKKRDEVAKRYIEVLNYGNGEWGIAGLSRASEALFDHVKALRDIPDPPMMRDNPEALDLFRTEIENIAFPVEEQGIGALEGALAKAFELGIYSEYTLAIEDRLRAFKPSKFGRVYELDFYPSTAASSAPAKTASR